MSLIHENTMQTSIRYLRYKGRHIAAIIGPQSAILQVWAAIPGHRVLQSSDTTSYDLAYNRSTIEESSEDAFSKYCSLHDIRPELPASNDRTLRMVFDLASNHPDMFVIMPKEKAELPSAARPFYAEPALRA